MAKVFVGNFNFAVDDEKLLDYFSRVGDVVSAKVMRDMETGRSRGFGFVEFSEKDDAAKAITELDGSVWDGRVVKVCEERSSRPGSGPADVSDGEDGGRHAPTGFFRAQPLDLGLSNRKKKDPFIEDTELFIDYKDPRILTRFVSERGKILPRRMTGLTSMNQRHVAKAIKRAQHLALLPYVKD